MDEDRGILDHRSAQRKIFLGQLMRRSPWSRLVMTGVMDRSGSSGAGEWTGWPPRFTDRKLPDPPERNRASAGSLPVPERPCRCRVESSRLSAPPSYPAMANMTGHGRTFRKCFYFVESLGWDTMCALGAVGRVPVATDTLAHGEPWRPVSRNVARNGRDGSHSVAASRYRTRSHHMSVVTSHD